MFDDGILDMVVKVHHKDDKTLPNVYFIDEKEFAKQGVHLDHGGLVAFYGFEVQEVKKGKKKK